MEWRKMVSLALIMAIPLTACGGDGEQDPEESTQASAQPEVSESVTPIEDLDGLEVEQGIFNVEITVPADFLDEGITQADLDAEAEESGFKSATLNSDGSATYVMTKSQHNEMMRGISESIDQALSDMENSEDYPTFTDVTANDDYTEFTVTTTATELGLTESFSTLAFYIYGGMYHAFNGTNVDDISVIFVNADSGEIIDEAHSSDAG